MADDADIRRRVPRTAAMLADRRPAGALPELGTVPVEEAVRAAQRRVRGGERAPERLVDEVLGTVPATPSSLHPVICATGVVLHTNLGRAPLSAAAVDALVAAAGLVDVESISPAATGPCAERRQSTPCCGVSRPPGTR